MDSNYRSLAKRSRFLNGGRPRKLPLLWGTEGSNPSPPSGESCANLIPRQPHARTIQDLARLLVMDRSTLVHLLRPLEKQRMIRLSAAWRKYFGQAHDWYGTRCGDVPPSLEGGGPIAEGVTKVNIGFNNLEYSYFPARTKVKAGTAVTFSNVGDIPHTATAYQQGNWDTGAPPSRRRAGRWPRARNSPARRQIHRQIVTHARPRRASPTRELCVRDSPRASDGPRGAAVALLSAGMCG